MQRKSTLLIITCHKDFFGWNCFFVQNILQKLCFNVFIGLDDVDFCTVVAAPAVVGGDLGQIVVSSSVEPGRFFCRVSPAF